MIRRVIKRRCNFMKTNLKVVVYVFRHNVLWLWLVLAIHDIPANYFVQNIFLWCLDDDIAALHLKLPLVLLEEIAQVNRVWDTLFKVLWEEAERKKDLSDLKIVPQMISTCFGNSKSFMYCLWLYHLVVFMISSAIFDLRLLENLMLSPLGNVNISLFTHFQSQFWQLFDDFMQKWLRISWARYQRFKKVAE